MIGTSTSEYIFIRVCISLLHWVIPLIAFCCAIITVFRFRAYYIPVAIEVWAVTETLFYFLVFLPRYYVLQRAAIHPPLATRQKRRHLFHSCNKTLKDPEKYLPRWFRNAPLSEIRRQNLKDFYAWAFLNKGDYGLLDDEELEEYVDEFETILGRKLDPGRGTAVPLRLTIDKVNMQHRPLLWYAVSSMLHP